MFKFIQRTSVRGDCTSGYNIQLDKDYTVKEFIETVLKELSKEWGYIGIYDKGSWFGKPCLEYKRGKVITDEKLEDYADKQIIEVTADGGWSRMDYILKCN